MVSVEELRAYLGAPSSADSTLELMEKAAVLWLENRTGRYFGETSEQIMIVNGSGSDVLFLPDEPSSVTSVRYRYAPYGLWTDLDPSLYSLERRKLYHLQSVWPLGRRNIEVVGDLGFEEGEAPADLKLAVMQLVGLAWGTHGSETISSMSLEGFSVTYSSKAMVGVAGLQDVLAKYSVRLWG